MRTNVGVLAVVSVLGLVASACGGDSPVTAEPASTQPVTGASVSDTTVPTTSVPAGGWIGGEPDWSRGAELETAAPSGDTDAAMAVEEADDAMADGRESASVDAVAEEAAAAPDVVDGTPLRAGSVDDNDDYGGFLDYLDRLDGLGIVRRDLDPRGRSVVSVTDEAGAPVPGAMIEASDGERIARIRTTADGSARFLPSAYGISPDSEITYTVDTGAAPTDPVVAAAGDDIEIVTAASPVARPVPLDVLFLLDATGSMGDEIDRLKTTIDMVAARIADLDPAPDVRFAMTLYRDEGDAFVTSTFDFTGDVDQFRAALADVVADGGGDYPEAFDEGLAAALGEPAWRDPAAAVQLVFVVADAPPHVDRTVPVPYTDSIRAAVERGIKIFPVASSESDDQAEAVFRQMAQATGAPFVFLSNGAAGAATGENTDIASTDYEELALDDLVVRLVAEELSALEGDATPVTVPTTSAPPPTNPPGQ